jgi:basic membrane protein A
MRRIVLLPLIILLSISCTKYIEKDYLTTVRLVTDISSIFDEGFNESAWLGILNFYGEDLTTKPGLGTAYDVFSSADPESYVSNVMSISEQEPSLIIATGFAFDMAIQEAAKNYPYQKYLIVDIDYLEESPNLIQAVFAEHEGSYLVGVAAASKALEENINNPIFGFIGGVASPTITKFEVGYIQGVLSVIPDAKFVDYYVNDWESADLAKEQARDWYNSGVYAVYAAAGGAGIGMIEEAKEQRQRGRNVWAIGVDSDQYELGKYSETDSAVLTSMIKRIDTAVIHGLNAVQYNTFAGGIITFDLTNNGVGYSSTNSALSNQIIGELDRARRLIITGETQIKSTFEEARKVPGFPQNIEIHEE